MSCKAQKRAELILQDECTLRTRNKNPRENNLEGDPPVRTFNHIEKKSKQQMEVLDEASFFLETIACIGSLEKEKESLTHTGPLAVPKNTKRTPGLELLLCSLSL